MESVELLNKDREILIDILTSELPVLRARLGISQEDISKCVGISRQTYSLVEGKRQKMTWVTFMALLSFFEYNPPAKDLLEKIGFYKNIAFKKCFRLSKKSRFFWAFSSFCGIMFLGDER